MAAQFLIAVQRSPVTHRGNRQGRIVHADGFRHRPGARTDG
ncbi:hypothetical protein [Streptomyces sp. NPDC093984]